MYLVDEQSPPGSLGCGNMESNAKAAMGEDVNQRLYAQAHDDSHSRCTGIAESVPNRGLGIALN